MPSLMTYFASPPDKASHDHEMLSSTCNRVIAFQPDGTIVDRYGTYDEYLYWMEQQKEKLN